MEITQVYGIFSRALERGYNAVNDDHLTENEKLEACRKSLTALRVAVLARHAEFNPKWIESVLLTHQIVESGEKGFRGKIGIYQNFFTPYYGVQETFRNIKKGD